MYYYGYYILSIIKLDIEIYLYKIYLNIKNETRFEILEGGILCWM